MPRAAQDIGPRPILAHPRTCSQTRFDPAETAWCDHFHGAAHARRRDGGARQTAPLGERVWLTDVRVERSCARRVWQTAPLAGCGRARRAWEMAPVAGRGCGVPAMVSLERRSWVELQGI
jgi:hypothetical protein